MGGLSKTSVEAMLAWNALETWTAVTTGEICGFAGSTGVSSSITLSATTTEDLCKAKC